jgi:chromosome segregation ATPase
MDAFFQGYNPYTGGKLPEQSRQVRHHHGQPGPQNGAYPQDTMAPPVNPNEVLDPLSMAQNELSKAKAGINQVRQAWTSVQREVNSAYTQTNRTANDLYPAENDTEETDNSRTGQYASSSLDQIERQLYNLRYDRTNPSSVLYEIKSQLANAQAYLNQVDGSRLPNPYRHSEAKSYLGQFQSQIYRIEMVQQQLEDKLLALQNPINSARYDLNAVSRDSEGQSVAYQARSARGNLTTLSQQLQQIDQHLRYADGDLTQAESAANSAEQNVQTAYQDYQYNWRTSDHR